MDLTREVFATALSSGGIERVNCAIDESETMELDERAALFDECCVGGQSNGVSGARNSLVRYQLRPKPVYALSTQWR